MTWEDAKRAYRSVPALWRDILVALLVIIVVMGSLWVYTGQSVSQAPLVVVESGSMMHDDPPYGRIGTIDPGDLILVKAVPDAGEASTEVVTMYGALAATDATHPGEGDRSGYGHPGDVVIYEQVHCPGGRTTPIIHRAITWIEVESVGGQRVFSYHDAQGRWLSRQGDVHLPEVQLTHERGFSHSGWVTKGDNPNTNRPADQNQICQGTLIKPDWLVGKARGEIPWIGLLKFIFQGNNWQTGDLEGVCVVGAARAPCDTFTMLWVSLGVIVLIPLAWDLVNRLRGKDDEEESGGAQPPHRPPAAIPPPEHPPHRPHERPPPPEEGRAPTTGTQRPRWVQVAEEEARGEKERRR